MRKRLQLLFILLVSLFYKGQDNSIAASVLTPVAYQTGVPDISFPLVSLPATKDLTLNFGLSYNPNSYKLGEYCGQVARNWSLSGSNFMITRKILNYSIDEVEEAESAIWNDIYYYNINGEKGSFKFEKIGNLNSPNVIIKIIKLTPSNVNIEFERETIYSNAKPVKSFTITDSKGYKYLFQNYDLTVSLGFVYAGYNIRNNFYVTSIADQSGNIVATFKNKKYIRDAIEGGGDWTYLPESITTKYGTIEIEHGNSGLTFDFHDRYYFKSFILKDQKNNFILKNELEISNSSYNFFDNQIFGLETVKVNTRILNYIKKVDSHSLPIDKIIFRYNTNDYIKYGQNHWWGEDLSHLGIFKSDNPNFLLYGQLKYIDFPTGSRVEYDFGANVIPAKYNGLPLDKNTISYIQDIKNPFKFTDPEIEYLKRTDSIAFDSKISKKYYLSNLQHTPNSRVYIKFNKIEIYSAEGGSTDPTLGPLPNPRLAYKVKNIIGTDISGPTIHNDEIETQFSTYSYIVPSNGTAFIELLGTGGNGYFEIYEKFWSDPPYINETTLPNSGVRIESVKYYDKAENFNPTDPLFNLKKITNFNYNLFNNVFISSGVEVPDDQKEAVIYNNIKITESDKPGYFKYYYKTALDYPSYEINDPNYSYMTVWPNYNLTKKGILDKKEEYTIYNNINERINYSYIFPPYNGAKQYIYETANIGLMYTQESYFDNITTTSTSYDSSGNSMTETMEKTFNQSNNNLMSEKRTSADGTVSETVYQYAAEKNNTKLLGANMFSVPLEVTQKQDGVQTGKLETRYDQSGNYFPSSVQSFGINNVITGEQTNDIYDTMGNVLQTTNKVGVPTAIIWGYDRTQPIAKIEGLGYNTMLALMGQSDASGLEIVQKSNQDISSTDNTNEQLLRDALETFRKKPEFKNYLITTYTYDPLIGVKSVTSPNGFTEYYFYDNQNRLIRVEDTSHNVIRENKYQQNVYTN